MKNEAIEELKLALQQVGTLEDINIAYRKAINSIDDYFEYRCESQNDQTVVHRILAELTKELSQINGRTL